MTEILRDPTRSAIRRTLRGVLRTQPYDTSDVYPGSGGAFSNAFSAAFDLNIARNQFSSAFSSAFAIFSRKKEFSSAFSDAFTNDNL